MPTPVIVLIAIYVFFVAIFTFCCANKLNADDIDY